MSVCAQYLVTSILLIAMSNSVMASNGEELYTNKCACCHSDENSLRVGTSKIKKALSNNNIRAHYFKLSDTDTKIIVDYLTRNIDMDKNK